MSLSSPTGYRNARCSYSSFLLSIDESSLHMSLLDSTSAHKLFRELLESFTLQMSLFSSRLTFGPTVSSVTERASKPVQMLRGWRHTTEKTADRVSWSRGGPLGYFHLSVSSSPVAIKPSSRDSAQPQPSWHYSPTTTSAQSLRAPRDLWIFCKDWLRDLLNSLHCLPRCLIPNTSFTIGNWFGSATTALLCFDKSRYSSAMTAHRDLSIACANSCRRTFPINWC